MHNNSRLVRTGGSTSDVIVTQKKCSILYAPGSETICFMRKAMFNLLADATGCLVVAEGLNVLICLDVGQQSVMCQDAQQEAGGSGCMRCWNAGARLR